MREFLLELYLQHGDRVFTAKYCELFWQARDRDTMYIELVNGGEQRVFPRVFPPKVAQYRLAPKALEYIKNA